jgi:hypothetical protein
MPDIVQKLQQSMEADTAHSELYASAIEEITELRKRRDALEEILIILARTDVPWDEGGAITDALPHFKERYAKAMHEAADLLGLPLRSTITRTEPRT